MSAAVDIDSTSTESNGTLLMRRLLVGGFLFFIAMGPLLYYSAERIKTAATTGVPRWNEKDFISGVWMKSLEYHLQELSPLAYQLRGCYNEGLYHLDMFEPRKVHAGLENWLFLKHNIVADMASLKAHAPLRRRSLESLRRRANELGVKILAIVVPDKIRIYPEYAFLSGKLPAGKEKVYPLIQEELAAAGIATFDLAARLKQEKIEQPDQPLYYKRDSHWCDHAMVVTAKAVMARLEELGWDDMVGERVSYLAGIPHSRLMVSDLVGMLGLRSAVAPGMKPPSKIVDALREEQTIHHVVLKNPDGTLRKYLRTQPGARVALCGTSFSYVGLHLAIPYLTKWLVDRKGVVPAGGSFVGLRDTLERIARGESNAKVVLWEFVERQYQEHYWQNPPVF